MISLSEAAFLMLLFALSGQRLWELAKSRRNERRLRAQGAVEHAPQQVPAMVALHVAWLLAMPFEVFAFARNARLPVSLAALCVFALGQALRLAAMRALGDRWTVKILTVQGSTAHAEGPFRLIRHPNYLGVWLETVALPFVHGAWLSALVFGALQAAFLTWRIRAEEAALSASTDYDEKLMTRPRFVPRAEKAHGPL